MQLVLVVSDCPLPPERAEAGEEMPELPALAELLSRGLHAGDSRPWQARLLAASPQGRAVDSLAGVAAAGAGAPGEQAWFAQPVHLQAATDHLRLPAGGLLRLPAGEQAALCADFARVFAADGFALHALCDGGLLLTGLESGAGNEEPSRRVGEKLDATGRSADPRLRRLASELELWLHEHAVNQARAQRGAPAINALWLWGGEALPADAGAHASTLTPARVLGNDAFIAGYAALLRLQSGPQPASLAQLQPAGAHETVLLQVSAGLGIGGGRAGLAALDELWLQPALDALRSGALRKLRLLLLDADVEMTRARTWRLWQKRRPWWETLRR